MYVPSYQCHPVDLLQYWKRFCKQGRVGEADRGCYAFHTTWRQFALKSRTPSGRKFIRERLFAPARLWSDFFLILCFCTKWGLLEVTGFRLRKTTLERNFANRPHHSVTSPDYLAQPTNPFLTTGGSSTSTMYPRVRVLGIFWLLCRYVTGESNRKAGYK